LLNVLVLQRPDAGLESELSWDVVKAIVGLPRTVMGHGGMRWNGPTADGRPVLLEGAAVHGARANAEGIEVTGSDVWTCGKVSQQ
jgi:hypothetical protein